LHLVGCILRRENFRFRTCLFFTLSFQSEKATRMASIHNNLLQAAVYLLRTYKSLSNLIKFSPSIEPEISLLNPQGIVMALHPKTDKYLSHPFQYYILFYTYNFLRLSLLFKFETEVLYVFLFFMSYPPCSPSTLYFDNNICSREHKLRNF